jgi:hypothetical protein
MTTDMSTSIRASRRRVPRSRGAMSGFLLLVLGAWAALAPMIGPYFDVAYTPDPNDAWNWTAARGWLEVLPGAATFLGGLLLLMSASRAMTMFGGWLAAAGGAWLIVGPPLADAMNIALGTPEPAGGTTHRAFDAVVLFYGVGAVILFVAAAGIGRLSVISMRDVQAAERRAAAEDADVAAMTNYPPAPPANEATEGERVDSGRHRGQEQVAADDERPTTAMAQPAWGEQRTSGEQPGQQPHFPPGYQPQYPPGQQSTYTPSAPPPREQS